MSMILDAIKRAKESDASNGGVPTPETEHYVASSVSDDGWSKWAVPVAVIIVTVLIILVVLFISTGERDDSAAPQGELLPPEDSVAASDLAGDEIAALGRAPAEPSGADVIAQPLPSSDALNRRALAAPVGEREGQSSIAAAAATSAAVESSLSGNGIPRAVVISASKVAPASNQPSPEQLSELYQAMNSELSSDVDTDAGNDVVKESTVASAAVESATSTPLDARENADGSDEPAIDFADILAQAQRELGVTPLVDSSEPLLETLSQQIKDQIPSLIYSEHNYAISGASSVVLNGETLAERQRAGAFTVIEILPDSVILRWRETVFRVRARNSWINL